LTSRPATPPLVTARACANAHTTFAEQALLPSVPEYNISDGEQQRITSETTVNRPPSSSPPDKSFDLESVVAIATNSVPLPTLKDAVESFQDKHASDKISEEFIDSCDFEQHGWHFIMDVAYKSPGFFEDTCVVSEEVANLFSAHCIQIMDKYSTHVDMIVSALRAAHGHVAAK
jgi:hypothetical protein